MDSYLSSSGMFHALLQPRHGSLIPFYCKSMFASSFPNTVSITSNAWFGVSFPEPPRNFLYVLNCPAELWWSSPSQVDISSEQKKHHQNPVGLISKVAGGINGTLTIHHPPVIASMIVWLFRPVLRVVEIGCNMQQIIHAFVKVVEICGDILQSLLCQFQTT